MVQATRKIIWSERSKIEKRQIFKYWNSRNKSTIYSRKLNLLFYIKIHQIADNPFIGRKTNEENVRIVVVRENLIIYKIFEKSILIVSIWEVHQNPDNLEI